jgi:hypothetical protein
VFFLGGEFGVGLFLSPSNCCRAASSAGWRLSFSTKAAQRFEPGVFFNGLPSGKGIQKIPLRGAKPESQQRCGGDLGIFANVGHHLGE